MADVQEWKSNKDFNTDVSKNCEAFQISKSHIKSFCFFYYHMDNFCYTEVTVLV